MSRGALIVIEGIDGGGKTTLRRGLAEALRAEGYEVVETKEPTDGPIGKKIREVSATAALRAAITPEEELALFHEDRRAHVDTLVRPALARGAVVLQDRSFFSTAAYQGERGLDREMILAESRKIAPEPDLLILVDLDPAEALSRIRRSRSEADGFEREESLRRVRDAFHSVASPNKIVVDGAKPAEVVLREALGPVLSCARECVGNPRT